MKRGLIGLLLIFSIVSCKKKAIISEQELTIKWGEMTIYILKNTPANSPTFASRTLGYIGLTMYESIVNGYPEYQSMAGQVNGLIDLEKPNPNLKYDWKIALNAGQAEILRNIYIQTSDQNKLKIDSLEILLEDNFKEDKEVLDRSKAFGKKIALQIFEWSKTDGGHRGYLHNFDKELKFAEKTGGWKPPLYAQSFSHHPLHPHWGENRTFVLTNSEVSKPDFIPYNTDPKSAYYQQFKEVYNKEKSLTQAEKEAALYWGDDPDETPTPPGHSWYLATQVIKLKQPSLIVCAETYARLGMSLADAFRNCWKWKYAFFTERPNTFIPANIDSAWNSFWPDPPFPAFPSGHAIQAAAAATVFIEMFGEKIEITDSLHLGRRRDELRDVDFKPRKFSSFWQIAQETADSRFYGGIHTQQDNLAGQIKGKEIAENVNKLKWKK
ncbi:phosphatase PAP2 family protein [Lacihabitans sp. LS3-19]|uniref:vanadium-dependent haloperoxidase n=1 Tax=Lacihabitans sp. LS3-19 TaxID=2487335 RepID=UPI0020CD1722|nr:vanadium-dependent haloperoxidase [Lacihabitans sp. LS3-19]MCP9766862.1 phosphatase PAP2 family protein [Lacihabitans sp. LS3-19]